MALLKWKQLKLDPPDQPTFPCGGMGTIFLDYSRGINDGFQPPGMLPKKELENTSMYTVERSKYNISNNKYAYLFSPIFNYIRIWKMLNSKKKKNKTLI
jgi:hypothetical protein